MNGPTFATSTAAPAAKPAGPRPNTPARPPAKPDPDNPAARVLTYLRLHWLTILFAGSLLGAGLAYAAWTLLPPKYESYAVLTVAQNPGSVSGSNDPNRSGRTEFATYVKSKASLLQTERIYVVAMRDYGLTDLPTIRQQKDVYKFFDEKLLVSSKEGSEHVRLSMLGDNPDDVKKIVDAIVGAFMKDVVEREVNDRRALVQSIRDAKVRLEAQLRVKTGGVGAPPATELANVPPAGGVVQAGGTDKGNGVGQAVGVEKQPIRGDGETERMQQARFNGLNAAVMDMEKSLPEMDLSMGVALARLEAGKKKMQEVLDTPPAEELRKAVEAVDPDYLKAKAKAEKLRNEYFRKRQDVNNPDAPAMQAMQRRAEEAEVEAEQVLRRRVDEEHKLRQKPAVADMQQKLDVLDDAVKVLTARKTMTQNMIAAKKKELASIPNLPESKQNLAKEKTITVEGTEVVATEGSLARLTGRLIEAELDADAKPRITVTQQASTPAQKDSMKQILATVFAGLLGFVLVGAGATLLEMRSRKVSSLGELKSSALTPVVGVVPWMPDGSTSRDPAKRADVNEAIDKLRSYVAQTWLSRGATTVTVTSALGDEGKAFTAFGLASSLAQAGYKTLLVDFDLRQPALHPYAGVANTLGVCELLRGEADFRRTIQVLPNGLHFLSAGKWSDDARQAAVGGRLEALLARLKEPFDCVVLHGHALLTVAESVEVARRSEVVLLCALYRDTRVPLLKKASERVGSMEIPYSGVVYLGATPNEALC